MTLKISDSHWLPDRMIHLFDCSVFSLPQMSLDPTVNIATTNDEMILYSLMLRPSYEAIGRIIGQLAGLFILLYAKRDFDMDFPVVAMVKNQLEKSSDAIRSIKPPHTALAHYQHVLRAFTKVELVFAQFNQSTLTGEPLQEHIKALTQGLKQAHAIVSGVAVEQLGMMPIDFSSACCSCSASSGT